MTLQLDRLRRAFKVALPGGGFIALWNDIDPRRTDYDAWHTIEHVPERLAVAGFLRAHRYVLLDGELPNYFTLYALDDLRTLDSDEYRRLLRQPSPATLGMRPDFRNFLRLACRTTVTKGTGLGGYAAVCLVRSQDIGRAAAIAEALMSSAGVSSVHLGVADHRAAVFEVSMPAADVPADVAAILVIEGYNPEMLRISCSTIETERSCEWSFYQLVFALRNDGVSSPLARGAPSDMLEGPAQHTRGKHTA